MAPSKYETSVSKGPPKTSFWTFIWNGETGEFLGRNFSSWVKITVFYIIFYAGLAAFFAACLQIFFTTLNDQHPKWLLDESRIGSNPGVGFRPMPDTEVNAESSLIWYRRDNEADAAFWYDQLTDFIQKTNVQDPSLRNCSFTNDDSTTETEACRVDTSNFKECAGKFGYPEGKPCVLVKLNKIYGWKPEPFGLKNGAYDHQTLVDDLTKAVEDPDRKMPKSLMNYIKDTVNTFSTLKQKTKFLETVFLSCEGENPADEENLVAGKVSYYPNQGIPGFYFPYQKQNNYRSPFVFVRFDLHPSTYGNLINIECKAWAKNIFHDRQNRLGSVHFEILVD